MTDNNTTFVAPNTGSHDLDVLLMIIRQIEQYSDEDRERIIASVAAYFGYRITFSTLHQ